ncbi:Rpn family recombination-promoting nuclease/putative transposase [Skermanella pratensis]|uniref:Rpn family recombination-promoting nuclease/putative transposase n=1 Tax=Skermanella pratensis TaxID=2233999 RepID=UPI001301926C|nr:Rpn family recombination-promoting nuclease/putative transposase [Skermanella pratensis]
MTQPARPVSHRHPPAFMRLLPHEIPAPRCRDAMQTRLIHRHDHFFKHLLDQPGTAGALIRERLPAAVAELISQDDPVLMPGSFVDKELREYRTDRLYGVGIRTGGAAFIYVLMEHKSSPDPRIDLQLLGYETRIWQDWDKREGRDSEGRIRKLPPIFPLVVYHGEAEWRIPLSFADGLDLGDEALRPHVLDFRYSLADLGRIDDDRLSREERLRVGLLILKHGTRDGDLHRTLVKLGRAAFALGPDDLIALVRYILSEPNSVETAILRDALKEIVPGQETRVMSIAAEEWKAEGILIGEARGKAEGKAEGKADILLRLLRRRFGAVPEAAIATIHNASDDQLNAWAENILDAATLDAVFTSHRSN